MRFFCFLSFFCFLCFPSLRADDACANCAPKAEAAAEKPARHPLKGIVKRVNAEKSRITVKHEEIPGFMAAMTMVFSVTAEDVKRLKEGDSISAVLVRTSDGWALEEIVLLPAGS
ncbi:copper-binding protein [Nibricoccus sp. IMCC34717]|uniref:copper-binding protein n=1 Tax=Nibricoccus sp. IMCC34717 TaxID=3034021 RepID=UPI00384FC529